MNEQGQSYGAVAVTQEFSWITISFILIAIGIVAALLMLWWGTRLAIRRRRARQELAARGELAPVGASAGDTGPAPAPVAEIAATPEPAAPAPAIDAAPAPLADEPIAAAGAFDASPASLAVDTDAAPAAAAPASERDDLTRLKGVGPKLAARLGELGIDRFADLAALDPAAAQALDAQLGSFQGRMTRDRWIEQARLLAAGDRAGYEAVFGKL
jgi:predicted flap endonuclease-1-like 5' DNA nuclease